MLDFLFFIFLFLETIKMEFLVKQQQQLTQGTPPAHTPPILIPPLPHPGFLGNIPILLTEPRSASICLSRQSGSEANLLLAHVTG